MSLSIQCNLNVGPLRDWPVIDATFTQRIVFVIKRLHRHPPQTHEAQM